MVLQHSISQRYQARRPTVWSQNCAAFSRIFFPSDTIDATASATKTFERTRKLTPLTFVASLAFYKADTIAYPDIASDIHLTTGEPITTQAVADKVKKSETMFRSLVAVALSRAKALPIAERLNLPGVGDILLADASTIALRNSLAPIFPGTGGNGPVAAVKLHGLFNLTTGQLTYLTLTEGTRSDQTTKGDHISASKPNDLLVRDLGYFELSDLDSLNAGGRFFLSRVPLKIKKFAEASGEALDIWELLATTKGFGLDRTLKIGDEKFLTRVIALRLPRKKWQARLKELAKEKGRPLSRREETQAKWNLLATNLTVEQAGRETVQRLYELRWQVELLWKSLKTGLGIDKLRAASCEKVVRAFIWAKLLCATILLAARALIAKGAPREIGLIRWFRRISAKLDKIRELIIAQRWLALARVLETLAIRYCLAEKHSKPSTREKVCDAIELDRQGRIAHKP
jgi:hypothetical protein